MSLMLTAQNFVHARVEGVVGDGFVRTQVQLPGRKPGLRFTGRLDAYHEITVTTSSGILGPKDSKRLTTGEVGCLLSHVKAIRAALLGGWTTAIIVEDDVTLELLPHWRATDFRAAIRAAQEASNGHWEILQLTTLLFQKWPRRWLRNQFDNGTLVAKRWGDQFYGTQAYVINRSGMMRLMKAFWGDAKWWSSWPTHVDISSVANARADSLLYTLMESYIVTRPLFLFRVSQSAIGTSTTTGQADNVKWIRGLYNVSNTNTDRRPFNVTRMSLICAPISADCVAFPGSEPPRDVFANPKCNLQMSWTERPDDHK